MLPRKQSPAAVVTARAKVAVPKAAEMTAEMAAEMAAAAAKEMELVGVVAMAGEEMEAVERTDRVTAMDGGKRKPARGVRESARFRCARC